MLELKKATRKVMLRDQNSAALSLFFIQQIGSETALTNATVIDDTTVVLDSVASCSIGDFLGIFSGVTGTLDKFYFGTILNIVSNTITLDTPIDFAFEIGDTAVCNTRDLNVNGSVTPKIFSIQEGGIGGIGSTISIDITRIMLHITDDVAMDDSRFGGITALTNGVVFRSVGGITKNYFNIKNNGELSHLNFDTRYADRAPAGFFGISSRLTYAGQSKHGVAVRLTPGDSLQIIIQDDLTALASFRIIAQGHIVEDD